MSAPVPFGVTSYWDLVVVGPKSLGTGLTILRKTFKHFKGVSNEDFERDSQGHLRG